MPPPVSRRRLNQSFCEVNSRFEPVFTQPSLVCIEILSKDDQFRDLQERVDEYLDFGVPHV